MNPTGPSIISGGSTGKTAGVSSISKGRFFFFMLFPTLITLLLYLPVLKNGFVNWDDDFFILHNYHIKSIGPDSLHWMFSSFYAGFLMPVYWLFLAFEYRLGGVDPWVYHLGSLLLHCLNTALVFQLCLKILALSARTGRLESADAKTLPWVASGAALIFGIHPLHVESVAWAAEQKDLLCGFFFLSGLLVYVSDASRPVRKMGAYGGCLALFALSMLSKPMAVSFPLVLILLDFWPLGRLRPKASRVLFEKIPFFLIALLAAGSVVAYQHSSGQTIGLGVLPMDFRVMNSLHSLVFYLGKMLWPSSLAAFYPIFLERCYSITYLVSALVVFLLSLACFICRKTKPCFLAAWLYYVVTLVPVLGLVQANSVAAADRYTYLPCLGPLFLLGACAPYLLARRRFAAILLAAGVASLLGYGTSLQISAWRDSVSLWEKVVEVNPINNPIVYTNLAYSYQAAGRLDDALRWYERAIGTGVPQANPHCGVGEILMAKGLFNQAIQEFKTGADISPAYAQPHYDLGMVYERQGLQTEALEEELEAVRLQPDFAQAYEVLGNIYGQKAQYDKSLRAFKTACSLDPDNRAYFDEWVAACRKVGGPNPVPQQR